MSETDEVLQPQAEQHRRAADAPEAVTEWQQAADESLCTAYPGVIRENMSPDVEVPNNM